MITGPRYLTQRCHIGGDKPPISARHSLTNLVPCFPSPPCFRDSKLVVTNLLPRSPSPPCFRESNQPPRHLHHRRQAPLHVLLGGGPGGDADPHRRFPLPHGAAAPADTASLYPGDYPARDFV